MRSATRSVALRARGFPAISRSGGTDRPADERQRRRRQRGGPDRQPGERRIAAERLRRGHEESLHDPVLERMEADHGEPAPRRQQRHDPRQDQRELRELAIDENPKSLERPRGRILTPITPRARADGFGHDRSELPRADDGCDRASRNNCSCNRLSKPFFTIVAYHLRQFARGSARQERGRRFAARGVHPHVERAVRAKREAAHRVVDLRRGNAEVEQAAVDAFDAERRERASASSENQQRWKTNRRSAIARAQVSAAGSRSNARSRPEGPSRPRIARAWPPRPNVASTYVPSGRTASAATASSSNTGTCPPSSFIKD